MRRSKSIILLPVPPTVRILRPSLHAGDNGWTDHHQTEEIKLSTGDELALVCKGTGDPKPKLKWTREVRESLEKYKLERIFLTRLDFYHNLHKQATQSKTSFLVENQSSF